MPRKITMVVGDEGPVACNVVKPDGSAFDLTGAVLDGIKVIGASPDTTPVGVITTALTGLITVTFVAATMSIAGVHEVEAELTLPGGAKRKTQVAWIVALPAK